VKIVQVPRRFVTHEWGGTETTILQTSRALQRAGHEVAIFTSLALSDTRSEVVNDVRIQRFPYTYPFFGLTAEDRRDMDKKGGNLLSLSLLLGLVREPGVDVLHAHTGKRVGGTVRTAARLRGIPYVVTLHGGYFEVPRGEMDQMLAPIQDRPEWGRVFGALLGSRRVLEDAAAVLCVGGDEYAAAKAKLPGQRVELIPNGVDCDAFSTGDAAAFRATHRIAPDRRIVLCVSRIDYQKNQIGLVEAVGRVAERNPRVHLVLLGPVTVAGYQQRLTARIKELGLTERVTLIPGLHPEDPMLPAAYHAAEVFCLPSLHEPFGIVILEAWAAGRPVVAARVGGIPSFTWDGEDIVLAAPGDVEDLAARLVQVLKDPALAARIAAAGQLKARRDFSWSAIAGRLLEIYRDLPRRKVT
jgi:glycosyltransferase involved in cell wall biosynthesis